MRNILDVTTEKLEAVFTPTSRFFMKISIFFMLIMPLPIFVDVLVRLIISKSVPGVPETIRFMMILVVYPALAFVQFSEGQLRIEILFSSFSPWFRRILNTLASFLTLAFFVLVCRELFWRGLDKLEKMELSWVLGIPIGAVIWIASLGAFVMVGITLVEFIKLLRTCLLDKHHGWLIFVLGLASLLIYLPFAGLLPMDDYPILCGLLGMAVLFTLIFLGVPIGVSMGLIGIIGMIIMYDDVPSALANMGMASYSSVASDIIAVAPMFVLMGQFVFHSGIGHDLFQTASVWLGRLRGGLAMASVAGCSGFAAVCGDSLATSVTMGSIAVPEMKKRKYSMRLATSCIAAGGTLGILIPPSMGFIFYAIVTEESIGRLFIAGMIPGLILAGLFMVTIYILAVLNPEIAPRGLKTTWKEKFVSFKGIFGAVFLFVIILGGILAGIFSPTEGGAIGAVGAFAFALIRRRLTWSVLYRSVNDTIIVTTKLILILIGVGILGYFLAVTELPFFLAEFVVGLGVNRYVIFTLVIVLFILLGCVMNVIPILLLILPTISPAIEALGFDNVWFGVVCVITMEMGQITPPIGVIVFALGSVVTEVPIQEIFKGVIPFFLCMVLCIVLITIFPQLALFLPNLFFG